MKRKPIVLDFEPATPEEMAKVYGMSKKRLHAIQKMVSESLPKKKAPKAPPKPTGYHSIEIEKGLLGDSSKIQEELDELKDAEKQGVKILIHCELADLYGALAACADWYGFTMDDLKAMSVLTAAAFENGKR
jgi:hypothetical protein